MSGSLQQAIERLESVAAAVPKARDGLTASVREVARHLLERQERD